MSPLALALSVLLVSPTPLIRKDVEAGEPSPGKGTWLAETEGRRIIGVCTEAKEERDRLRAVLAERATLPDPSPGPVLLIATGAVIGGLVAILAGLARPPAQP